MEGTVTWARRDDGRPALAGTGVGIGATGATTGLDLAGDEEAAVGIVTDLAAGLDAGLETEIGVAFTAAFGAGLSGVLLLWFWAFAGCCILATKNTRKTYKPSKPRLAARLILARHLAQRLLQKAKNPLQIT